jgi:aryl-alcohol dehydrogenase-like predicted oxidoreductase
MPATLPPRQRTGAGELWLSSIGLGTYLGDADAATDAAYTESIASALRSGINVLDTAISYRHQRSGATLAWRSTTHRVGRT